MSRKIMDAAQTNNKKFALFLALALLLTVSAQGFAQPVLTPASSTVNLGSSSCNDLQTVLLTSSDGTTKINFTVSVNYPNGTSSGDANGSWVYATVLGVGTTSTGTTYPVNTGTSGVTLNIGLNRSFAAASDVAQIILTPTSSSPAGVSTTQVVITVDYQNNTSCGGNTGSAGNGQITIPAQHRHLAAIPVQLSEHLAQRPDSSYGDRQRRQPGIRFPALYRHGGDHAEHRDGG
jgi:hypothetical protein